MTLDKKRREDGVKEEQITPEEEVRRKRHWKEWHKDLGPSCPAFDVDAVECRTDGSVAALLEITHFRDEQFLGLEECWQRIAGDKKQHGAVLTAIGKRLGLPVYVVAVAPGPHRPDQPCYMRRLDVPGKEWKHRTMSELANWLQLMRSGRTVVA